MRLLVNHALPLAALLLAGANAGTAQARPKPVAPAPMGPAADYPVTVGEPFTIGGTKWTPADQLNYDAVGQANVQEGLTGISGAHKTLPLPSYAEITSLDTGRTILVRLIERGPMDNETLVALSREAASQLGMAAGTRAAVRVRRVNPPEIERAALRTGGTVPPRMETPESLLKVLRRKLAEQSPLMPPPSTPPKMPTTITATDPDAALPAPAAPPANIGPKIAGKPLEPKLAASPTTLKLPKPPAPIARAPVAEPRKAIPKGGTVVQVAAFSTADRARKAAAQLGGQVSPAGRLWRVRLGPFKGSGEASSALEKAKAAGYSDARIQRAD